MKKQSVNTFDGVVDSDSDQRAVGPGDFVASYDMYSGMGSGKEKARVPMPGNRVPVVSFGLPTGVNQCLGAFENKARGRLLYMVSNSNGDHGIYEYDPAEEATYTLVMGDFLNFTQNFPIHSGAFVRGNLFYWTDVRATKEDVIGNPPRVLNIDRANDSGKNFQYELLVSGDFVDGTSYTISFFDIDGNPTGSVVTFATVFGVAGDKEAGLTALDAGLSVLGVPETVTVENIDGKKLVVTVDQQEIRAKITSSANDVYWVPLNHYKFTDIFPVPGNDILIEDQDREFQISRVKYQPQFAPSYEFEVDASFNSNYVNRIMPQFAYRYIYADGEKSAWSAYSHMKVAPDDTYNRIKISFADRWLRSSSGLGMIRKIEFAVRYGDSGPFRSIKILDTGDLQVATTKFFYWYNDSLYPLVASDEDGGAPDDQVLKNFDHSPRLISSIEVVVDKSGNSRLVDFGTMEGRDLPQINIELDPVLANTNDGAYKKNSRFGLGLVYADRSGRRTPVIPGAVFTTGNWIDEEDDPYAPRVTIKHLPPDWATHYYIVRTRNLSVRRWKPLLSITDPAFSVDGASVDDNIQYGKMSSADEGFVVQAYGDSDNTHVRFRVLAPQLSVDDADNIVEFFEARSPSWFFNPSEGDRFRVIRHSPFIGSEVYIDDDYELVAFEYETVDDYFPVSDPDYKVHYLWLYAKIDGVPDYQTDYPVGDPEDFMFNIELYTPRTADDGIYYEVYGAEIIDGFHRGNVQNQTAGLDAIVNLRGTGDSYFRENPMPYPDITVSQVPDMLYEVENPFKFTESKFEGVGKPSLEDPTHKEVFYSTRLRPSDIYLQSGTVNGLSAFRGNNYIEIDQSFGIGKRLIMAGNVLLAVCEFKAQPIYVGEGQVYDLSGNTTVGRSDSLLNIARPLQGDYGTMNPESVIEEDGRVFWYDRFKGAPVQYDANGVSPVWFKRIKYFQDRGDAILYEDQENTKTLSGFDRKRGLWFLTVGNGRLDGGLETVGYSPAKRGWEGNFRFAPEAYGRVGQQMYMFKDGALWIHGKGNATARYFGVQYTPQLDFVMNEDPLIRKVFMNISLQVDKKFYCPLITTPANESYKLGQQSRLLANKFSAYEGRWRADFLNDENDTSGEFLAIANISTRRATARLNGRALRNDMLFVRIQQVVAGEDFALFSSTIEWVPSAPI